MIFIIVYIIVAIVFSAYMVDDTDDIDDVAMSCLIGMFWPLVIPFIVLLRLIQALAKCIHRQ